MQASQLQLEEIQHKLRLAANIRASDAPDHGHAPQATSKRQEATAPSQPALRADSKGPHGAGHALVIAASSRDISPELPHARAAPSSPDAPKQVNAEAAMECPSQIQHTEDTPLSMRPESADQLATKPAPAQAPAFTQATKQQTGLVATPSAAHTSTAPQVAAESHMQPGNSVSTAAAGKESSNSAQQGSAAAKQSGNNTQQARVACTRGEEMATLPGATELDDRAVSNQAATQEASAPMQMLLGLSSVTPLPPPVPSPTKAVPSALTAAPQSPNGPSAGRGQNPPLGWTAVTPLPSSIPLPTAAQGQGSPSHQTSSSPASTSAALALTVSDAGQQPPHVSPLLAQASALSPQASPLPAQASPLPAQTSALSAQATLLPAQTSPLPGALISSQHTTAEDSTALPQQVPVAAALQSSNLSMAGVPSGCAKDDRLADMGASGEAEISGAADAHGTTAQPVADGGLIVCLHGSYIKP